MQYCYMQAFQERMIMKQSTCDLILTLRQSVRVIARELGYLESRISHIDITMPQLHILLEINKHETLTVAELARILNLNQSSTCRTIAELRKKQWIKTIKLLNDKKQKPVQLTSLGKDKVKQINSYCGSFYEKALMELPKEKQITVVESFDLYANALSKIKQEETTSHE